MDKDLGQQVTMSINDAARIVGVTAATIRNWEKAGLITPRRTAKQYRVFTGGDIERLRKIKEFSIDKNMNLSTISSLLGKDYSHQTGEASNVTRTMLGQKWQKDRLKKGLSLADVADRIGISASYLAKIEAAQANVSLDILERLADFYGENLLYYFESGSSERPYVSTGEKEKFTIGLEGVVLTSRSTLPDANLSPMTYTVQPLSGRMQPNSHHGEEFLYMLLGTIEFHLKDEVYLLHEGDSIHYHSSVPHHWRNPSETQVAKMLWVYTDRREV